MADKMALVLEWMHNGERFRLLRARDPRTPKPNWCIEKQTYDQLGDPKWEYKDNIGGDPNGTSCILANVIAGLVLNADPALVSALRLGGWDAVTEIQRTKKECLTI